MVFEQIEQFGVSFLVQICLSIPFARILSRIFDLFCRCAHLFLLCHWHRSSGTLSWFSVNLSFCDGKFGIQWIQVRSRTGNYRHTFCVAGSDWWANYKSLLEDSSLKHEFGETRDAERFKFGDGGRGSFETLAFVDFFTPAWAVVEMGEETLRIGTGVDNLVSRLGHLALQLNPIYWYRKQIRSRIFQCVSVQDGRCRIHGPKDCSNQSRQ